MKQTIKDELSYTAELFKQPQVAYLMVLMVLFLLIVSIC